MFLDANELPAGTHTEADVCIVGAGAAGITLARTLARNGITTALLESGGMAPEPQTQRLYDVINRQPQYYFENDSEGSYVLSTLRVRYFGGSTNHWGGQCRPLDEEDFLPRAWVAHSGWPIRRADLDPYYPEAMSVLDLPPHLHGASFDQIARDSRHAPPLLDSDSDFAPIAWFQSAPTRMNQKYRDEIGATDRIRCVLHANATEVLVDPDGRHVTRIAARTLGGRTLTCGAQVYVLCTGGIENARLLLLSDSVVAGGIGNRHGMVGRYLMEHPSTLFPWLALLPHHEVPLYREEDVCERARQGRLPGVKNDMLGFATRSSFRRRHRLPACSINAFPVTNANEDAVPDAIRDLLARSGHQGAAPGDKQAVRVYRILMLAEQVPNPSSRVTLGTELDALGQRKTVIAFRSTDDDRRNVRVSLTHFTRALGALGRGRLQLAEPEIELRAGGGHDLGTTRMADDPSRGVTDRHCRVHGVDNLYVAGNSLFPTVGFANPTLTLVALTLRLADRLRGVVPPTRGSAVTG